MNVFEEILLSLKVKIPSKFIFAALGIIQAAIIYLVDQGAIPEYLFKIHTDKLIIAYSIMVMVCYNGKRKFRLLLSSLIACSLIFIPIASYHNIDIALKEISHANTNYFMLSALYPIVFSACYYHHNFGINLTNTGNQAYLSFWTPIIKLLIVGFYFVMTTLILFMFGFITKLSGFSYIWEEMINISFIKAYIPISLSLFLWIIYKHPDVTENVIRGSAYLAHHLYWIIAPLGTLFMLSTAFSAIILESLPEIDYTILFGLCLFSSLMFQLANYPEENSVNGSKITEKLVVYYNSLLPLIPLIYLFHIITNFYEVNGDISCNQSIIDTGLNWGNFAPTLGAITLIYLTLVQAYYSHTSKSKMQQKLAIDSWWVCIFYSISCLIAFNPYFNLNPENSHYHENCHHFQTIENSMSKNLGYPVILRA
jgi:hypothetical protein